MVNPEHNYEFVNFCLYDFKTDKFFMRTYQTF